MDNNKLYDYLGALSTQDWKSIKKHFDAHVPDNTDLKVLAAHILKHHKSLPQQYISIDYIHNKHFREKRRKSVLNLFSELTGVVKDFLIQDQLKEDPYYQKVLLLQALNKRQLYKRADALRSSVTKSLKNEKISWWNALYLQLINHHYYFSDNPETSREGAHKNLHEAVTALNGYSDQINALYNFDAYHNLLLNKPQYGYLIDNPTSDNHEIYSALQLIKTTADVRINSNDEKADELLQTLLGQHQVMATDLRLIIYIILRLHYAKKANIGNLKSAKVLLELQRFFINHKYLDYHNQISPLRFLGVVELAAFLNESAWANSFIEQYKLSLIAGQRNTVISIANAFALFGKKQFEESVEILSTTYPKDIRLKSTMNRLLLINYLELYSDNVIFLDHRIKNYKLFFYRNRKRLSKNAYRASLSLAQAISMIANGRHNSEIKEFVIGAESLFYRLYLHNKLSEIKMGQD